MVVRRVRVVGGLVSAAWVTVVAAAGIGAGPGAFAVSTPPSPTVLSGTVSLAHGELRFEAPAPGTRPRQRAAAVRSTAATAAGAEAVGVRPRLLFGLFSAASPARKGPDGSTRPVFDRRPVWIVRYARVRVRRASGVVERRVPPSTRQAPTTVDPIAVVDIVVVIDDRDGRQLLRSEFAAERVVGLDVAATTTAVPFVSTAARAATPTAPPLAVGPTSTSVPR